jgi:hypothetical protein
MELTVLAVKREDGLYHFNHPHNDTVEELLCNGTEDVIDTHYYFLTAREPKPGDEIQIYLTTEEPDDWDTKLTFMEADKEGSTYMDEVLCSHLWLCPWLQGYFGEIPDNLYVQVDVVNKGLKNFVKATGMKKLLDRK